MRIAVWSNLCSGGAKRALYDHVNGLRARGHELECWSPATADTDYLPLQGLVPEHIVDFRWPFCRLNKRFPTQLYNYQKVFGLLWLMRDVYRRCAAQIEAGGFDMVYAHGCRWMAVPALGRLVSIPSVLYLAEPHRRFYEADPCLPWVRRPRERGLSIRQRVRGWALRPSLRRLRTQGSREWRNAQAFTRILVNSHYSRETVIRVYGRDARVCYLGVDTDRFRFQGGDREPFVLGLGALQPLKGVDFAIRSVAALPSPRPRLIWIGNLVSAAYLRELRRLARELDVAFEPRIMIAEDELVALLCRARLLLYTPRLEPFGYAVLEAGACGTPVVGVAEAGVRETLKDGVNGFAVPREPAAAAGAMRRLLTDKRLARRIGKQAREYVENNWALPASIERVERFLQGARGGEGAGGPSSVTSSKPLSTSAAGGDGQGRGRRSGRQSDRRSGEPDGQREST